MHSLSCFSYFLLFTLPFASTALAQASPQTSRGIARPDKQVFHELLNAVPEESLHAALTNHLQPKYQKGVFEFTKAAMSKVHDDDPLLASKLVIYAAKLELMKRATTNSSTPSSTPSSTEEPSRSVPTSEPTDGPTTTSDPGTSSSESTNGPAESSTAPPGPSSTSEVPTSTNSDSSTLVTTHSSEPPKSSSSSMVIITTTLPDGKIETITSYTVIAVDPTGLGAGGPGTTASNTRGPPSLQSGAANVLTRGWAMEAAALVGGAVGVAWIM